MEVSAQKNSIRILSRQGFVYLVLFALILGLPQLFFRLFAHNWFELIYQSTVDIAMLEWTGGFFNIFLFLLLFEYFRQTERKAFMVISCGFLGMGILGFFYALILKEVETAVWIKGASLLLGSVAFLIGSAAIRAKEKDVVRSIFHYVIPVILIALVVGACVVVLQSILPRMISVNSQSANTLFARFFHISVGAIYFMSACTWLHDYLNKRDNISLIFSIVFFVYAQMAIVVNYAPNWTFAWWLWHIVLVVSSFLIVIYLLSVCVRKSLIWRLLLSLGFAFGITIIITTAAVQSYTDRLYLKIQEGKLDAQQKLYLNEQSFPIIFSLNNLKTLHDKIEHWFELQPQDAEKLQQNLKALLTGRKEEWPDLIISTGISVDEPFKFSFSTDRDEQVYFRYRSYKRSSNNAYWTMFRYDTEKKVFTTSAIMPLQNGKGDVFGYVYNTVDVTGLKKKTLSARSTGLSDSGRIIFNKDNGQLLYVLLPADRLSVEDDDKRWNRGAFRVLMAMCTDISNQGKILNYMLQGKKYSVFANVIPNTNLVVMDIISQSQFHTEKMFTIRYVIAAVAMVALLVSFILLLLLLNFQLAKPLRIMLEATTRLQKTDFSSKVELECNNELGFLARAFNHMVEELKSSYQKMEQLLKSRTEALKFVENANRSQLVFFENVTHELRTPLHGILNFSRFGLDKKFKKKYERLVEFFSNIHASASRLMDMIQNLLDVAVFDIGDVSMDYSRISLFVVVLQVYDEMKLLFEDKEIVFHFEKPNFDTTVEVDRKKMSLVIKHVLSNALRYSPKDSRITLELKDLDDSISVSFIDQGPGIPDEMLDKVFERFTHEDLAADDQTKGYGLSICKEIIKLHHGRIQANNLPEHGFILTFTIPKVRSMVEEGEIGN